MIDLMNATVFVVLASLASSLLDLGLDGGC